MSKLKKKISHQFPLHNTCITILKEYFKHTVNFELHVHYFTI